MSSVLTNRLVGSAILIIAAVVFLPDLLDGQKEIRKDDFKAIPERPEFAKVTEPVEINTAQHQAAQHAAQQLPTDTDPQPLDTAVHAEQPTVSEAGAASGLAAADNQPETNAKPLASQQAGQAAGLAVTTQTVTTTENGTVQTGTMEKPLSTEPGLTDNVAAEAAAEQLAAAGKSAASSAQKSVDTAAEPAKERNTATTVVAGQTAFVVKVGSFGKSQNAEQLVSKLKAAGFPAFTRKIRTAQGTEMVSVMVGPELKKAKLETQLPKLQSLAQIPGLKVISYQVVENN